MKFKKIVASVLTIVLSICILFNFNVLAAETSNRSAASPVVPKATGTFDIDIDPGQLLIAEPSFLLRHGNSHH